MDHRPNPTKEICRRQFSLPTAEMIRSYLQLLPVAADPNIVMMTPFPMAAHPNGAAIWPVAPVTMHPNPASTPFPRPRNPYKGHVRLRRNDFNLCRRRLT